MARSQIPELLLPVHLRASCLLFAVIGLCTGKERRVIETKSFAITIFKLTFSWNESVLGYGN
jgi:hypothetical protein